MTPDEIACVAFSLIKVKLFRKTETSCRNAKQHRAQIMGPLKSFREASYASTKVCRLLFRSRRSWFY